MPLYRWNADNLEPMQPTTFEAEAIAGSTDLQRLLRDQPDVLEEGLFVVAEEFSNWEDSTNRRIDLASSGPEGKLVVVELKADRQRATTANYRPSATRRWYPT